MWSEPITDRSQSDISYAKENQSGSTDNKGALNYNDLNRIENNYKYLIEKLKNDAIYIQHMNRNFEETVYEIQEEELPYTELEYIESNGTQYINTGINPTSNLIIKAKFLITDTPSNFYALYGSRNSGDSLAYWVFLNYTDGKIVLRYKTRTNKTVEEVNALSGIHILEQDNNKITIDGYSAVADTNTIESTYPIYLFANNNVNSPQYQSHMRFYYFQIYDNDILVRDFIPAKDKNNIVCLYDDISKTFFYSESGDFTAGSVIDIEDKVVKVEKTFTDWQEECSPWTSEINRIRSNYNNLTAGYLYGLGFPVLEDSDYLTFEEVNTWESIALKCKEMIENMEKSYIYCGTIQSGGGILL